MKTIVMLSMASAALGACANERETTRGDTAVGTTFNGTASAAGRSTPATVPIESLPTAQPSTRGLPTDTTSPEFKRRARPGETRPASQTP